MEPFLIIIIIILTCVIGFQYKKAKKRSTDLAYITKKLDTIIKQSSSEKLFVFTEDPQLKSLLVAINHLLDHNQKNIANYARMEMSMRKMLSNISHDIKTPLTVILGYVEMLNLDQTISRKEQERLLLNVHRKTQEVLELIHKFFDLAKLEAGDKEMVMTRVDMNEMARKSILSFYDMFTAKGFDVHISIPEVKW